MWKEYFSDGASAQYKNRKKILNLCFHEEDFCVSTKWHFFETSHGKDPYDGIGGTTRRLATKASLQINEDPITTPQKLFVWACHVATDVSPEFSSNFRTLPDDVTVHARQDSRQRHLEVTGVVVLTVESNKCSLTVTTEVRSILFRLVENRRRRVGLW